MIHTSLLTAGIRSRSLFLTLYYVIIMGTGGLKYDFTTTEIYHHDS